MNDDGFCILEGVFSPGDCMELLAGLDTPQAARSRAGARHLMSHPAVKRLAYDPRMLAIARHVFQGQAVPYRATLFEKSGRSNWLVVWHQDTAVPLISAFEADGWGPWSQKAGIHYAHAPTWALEQIVALRLHLDDSTADNGPLRVIPASHRLGVLADEQVFDLARQRPHLECLARRGGVMAMRPLLIHSSQKSRCDQARRVLHVEYATVLELAPGIALAVA